jgi:hypothetical protein
MRSRPARLTLCALALIALGAAAFFTFQIQQQIDHRRTAERAFNTTARDAADALSDAQAGQQAYVTLGQDAREWEPKVATYLQTASSSVDALRATAHSQAAGPALLDASTQLTQIGNIDRRLRQQLAAGEAQAVADAVFSEAADAISSTVSDIDAATEAETQAADAFEAGQRRIQVYALGGSAAFAALLLLVLGISSPAARPVTGEAAEEARAERDAPAAGMTLRHAAPAAAQPLPDAAPATPKTAAPERDTLKPIAEICTEFGRVRDADHVKRLLEQAAALVRARGLIVWLGSTAGADLRPVLAYGYSEATLARIATVPRSADNAAAAAYRTGEVQIVKSRPGGAHGAVVAPLLSADGCIGALTAEVGEQGEASERVRAVAVILASQLAGVLAAAAATATDAPGSADTKAAAAS